MAKDFNIDAKKATPEEIQEGLKLLGKKRERQHKIETGQIKGTTYKPYSELTEKEKEQRRSYARKLAIRKRLLADKAKAAGITVSDAEVEAELRKTAKK